MRFLDLNPLRIGEPGGPGQPGLSAIQNGKWVHGDAAFALCRQDPQSTRFTVWEQLNLDPAGLPGGMRHLADLAKAQLESVCRDLSRDCWTVFTPVHWSKAQLQVFLGVAAACEMDVRVLLPRVLAANHHLTEVCDSAEAWEWHWNKLYRVELCVCAQGLSLKNAHPVDEGGVLSFFRRQSRAAAKWALETQRLDPLYSGSTEQQLFESWWQWLQGGSAWVFKSTELQLDLSDQIDLGPPVHEAWKRKQGLEDQQSASYPAALARALGWPLSGVECEDLQAVDGRLGDVTKPGARWKELLPQGAAAPAEDLPVTHWVIDGLAEAVPGGSVAGVKPGEHRKLADGREGLAIHVPEG